MTEITSSDNKIIKHAAALKEKKYRDLYGEYLVEGLRGVSDTPRDALRSIFCTKQNAEALKDYRCDVYIVTEKIMKKLSDTDNFSGIVAVAAKAEFPEFNGDYVVYLDRIRDPGNMGAIIRTAVAAGYEVVCDGCVDVYNAKVVRSCVSALSKVRLHVGNFIDILRQKGYNIIGADIRGKNMFSSQKPGKVCLVIGNEANGICDEIIANCDMLCRIPMQNMESLNAAVSAGILMYYFKY